MPSSALPEIDPETAAERIRNATLEDFDAAIETGSGPLAEALRALAPEIDMPAKFAGAAQRAEARFC